MEKGNKTIDKGCGAKDLALLQNQCKPSQLGKLIILITWKMIHKGKKYGIKLRKYYFYNKGAYTENSSCYPSFILYILSTDECKNSFFFFIDRIFLKILKLKLFNVDDI